MNERALDSVDDLKSFYSKHKWLKKHTFKIYRFIYNDKSYKHLLRFNSSMYYKYEIIETEQENLVIRIWYIDDNERDCSSYLDIPFQWVLGNYEEYIAEMYLTWKEKDKQERERLKEIKEKQEREIFEMLKQKYEPIKNED